MIRFLSAFIFLGAAAMAEPIAIRSGDHASFARLVLSIPEGAEWDVGRMGDDVGVVLSDHEDGFDTDGIFDRIPRNRIGSVSSEDRLLRLELVCDCHADAFLWQADRLVVDIVDGPPPPGNPFDMPLLSGGRDTAQAATRGGDLPILLPRDDRHRLLQELMPFRFTQNGEDERITAAQSAVMVSLARAATEGFFELPTDPVQMTFADEEEDRVSVPRVVGLTPVTDPMAGFGMSLEELGGPGLALRSTLTDLVAGREVPDQGSRNCLPDSIFDVAAWAGDGNFAKQVSKARSALTTEFDRYPPGSIEELAGAYIYFGFGAEARRVLSLDGNQTLDRALLAEMALIVDGHTVPDGRLAAQQDCTGKGTLWLLMARSDIADVGSDIRGEAVREFRTLPPHLRTHLGPLLAEKFLSADDAERARDIIDQVPSGGAGLSIDASLVRAEVDDALGTTEEKERELSALAEDSARLPPEALAQLLELKLERGAFASPEEIELAHVLLYETRPIGGHERLAAALARTYIALDDFGQAEAIMQTEVSVDSDTFGALANDLFAARVDRLSDLEVLELALEDSPPNVRPELIDRLAGRLIDMGFPNEALQVLEVTDEQQDNPERRYLRAGANALLGKIEMVEQELGTLDDARARDIRTQTFSLIGDHVEAFAVSAPAADAREDQDLAWRAGAWDALAGVDDPLIQSVSRLALQPTLLSPDLAELEARNALLGEAARTREMAEELLGRFSLEN